MRSSELAGNRENRCAVEERRHEACVGFDRETGESQATRSAAAAERTPVPGETGCEYALPPPGFSRPPIDAGRTPICDRGGPGKQHRFGESGPGAAGGPTVRCRRGSGRRCGSSGPGASRTPSPGSADAEGAASPEVCTSATTTPAARAWDRAAGRGWRHCSTAAGRAGIAAGTVLVLHGLARAGLS